MKVLNHKPEIMDSQRKVNPLIRKARAEQSEAICTKQDIQRRLGKVKSCWSKSIRVRKTVR
jgi:hypothetical protein